VRATSPQRLSLSAKHPQVLTATWAGMTDAITTADWRASRDLLRPGRAGPSLVSRPRSLSSAAAPRIRFAHRRGGNAGFERASGRQRLRLTASTSGRVARDGRTAGDRSARAQTQFCCRERSSTLLTAYNKHRTPQLHVTCPLTNHY